ncbi:MAG: hypothetical protein RLY14_2688, partial [Planctomycetota bacterium]
MAAIGSGTYLVDCKRHRIAETAEAPWPIRFRQPRCPEAGKAE